MLGYTSDRIVGGDTWAFSGFPLGAYGQVLLIQNSAAGANFRRWTGTNGVKLALSMRTWSPHVLFCSNGSRVDVRGRVRASQNGIAVRSEPFMPRWTFYVGVEDEQAAATAIAA